MADGVFNIAAGRVVELYNNVKSNSPANSAFIVVLLTAVETDDTLNNYDDLDALLGAAGNTEATFTGYARKVITDTELAALPAPDDTNNRRDLDIPDQTWTPSTSQVTAKLLVCYDPDTTTGDDTTIIPLTYQDFVVTTDSEFTAVINAAGFFRAAA